MAVFKTKEEMIAILQNEWHNKNLREEIKKFYLNKQECNSFHRRKEYQDSGRSDIVTYYTEPVEYEGEILIGCVFFDHYKYSYETGKKNKYQFELYFKGNFDAKIYSTKRIISGSIDAGDEVWSEPFTQFMDEDDVKVMLSLYGSKISITEIK